MLERFETAVLEMDERGIAAACPLLAPLGLATQGQELYLGFARRKLEAELQEGIDESAAAVHRLPAIYNVSAAFLRRCVMCVVGERGGRAFFFRGGAANTFARGRSFVLLCYMFLSEYLSISMLYLYLTYLHLSFSPSTLSMRLAIIGNHSDRNKGPLSRGRAGSQWPNN